MSGLFDVPISGVDGDGYQLDLERVEVDALDFIDSVQAPGLQINEIARLLSMWRGDPRTVFEFLPRGEWAPLMRAFEQFLGHINRLPAAEVRQIRGELDEFADRLPDLTADVAWPAPAAPVRRHRLLIVENEAKVAEMLASILIDYDTRIALTLTEAMQVVIEQIDDIDGALIDLHLTERMDSAGLEVLAYIRDRRPELPRVLITASPPPGSQEQMRRVYGIMDILVKGADGYSANGVRDAVAQMFNEAPEAARQRATARLRSHAIQVQRRLNQQMSAARRGIRTGERSAYTELERCTDRIEQFDRDSDITLQQMELAAPAELDEIFLQYVRHWPLDNQGSGAAA
ncbi:response regulator [Dactylosporangium sp. NPDC000244]|uniref:response regulator n=1 Tax=Dactylosporangium sp. NPDC000244 TaxID=3154365 RepID=UPI00332D54EC